MTAVRFLNLRSNLCTSPLGLALGINHKRHDEVYYHSPTRRLRRSNLHCKDKQVSSLRIFSVRAHIAIYYQAIGFFLEDTVAVFDPLPILPCTLVSQLVHLWRRSMASPTLGRVVKDDNCRQAVSMQNGKRSTKAADLSMDSPARPILNILARMFFQP